MSLRTEFKTPEIKTSFDWQLVQEINVYNQDDQIIAKAEIELITLNKHRNADKSYNLLAEVEATDWELPLNLYFKGQNLSSKLCESLNVTPDVKKAKTHIMIEAISVLPKFRGQGIANFLLQEIAQHYPKVQSLTVLTMPLKLFIDADELEDTESKSYYQQLLLEDDKTCREQLIAFFQHNGFIEYKVDEALLHEPLSFNLLVSCPANLLA